MRGAEQTRGLGPKDWALILLALIALKQGYALAGVDQLQWILRPLVWLLQGLSGLAFERLPNGEWLDPVRRVLLVKACAGGNFLLTSWLGYLWRWRGLQQGASQPWRIAAAAFAAAWLTSLVANALRILVITYGAEDVRELTGLPPEDCHRLLGITIYFGVLWLQLAGPRRGTAGLLIATALYLGINLLLPALRALALDLAPLDLGHVLWTAGVPLLLVMLWGGLNFGRLRQ